MRHLKPILFAVFVLVALTLSCVEPLDIVSPDGRNRFPADALIISPRVLGVPATKANIDGDESLNENKLASLDIFVYRKSGGTNFFHRYTLNESETQQLVSGRDYLLESNWRTAKYPDSQGAGYEGNTFKIYVLANLAVNNRDAIPASPTEAELRAFISTSKQSISGSYDVVRLVDGKGPGTEDWYNPHIKDNLFLMDGMIDNWTPASNAAQQYFTKNSDKSFELRRAAAKFKVTLDFDPAFLAILGTADADKLNFTKTEYWPGTQVKKTEVVTNIGNAQYKFANFMPATYDFNPAGTVSPDDLKAFRDANLWESAYRYDFADRTPVSAEGSYKYPYATTTYSYAFSWDADEAAEKAPALAVSIIYTRTTKHYNEAGELTGTDTPVAETNYYRIPLVDVVNATTPVKEVHRNYFYQVDALISSMGAAIIDIEPTPVKLKYQVIPWSFNPATDITEVEGTELLYFTADTTYTLRGENTQSIRLDYFTPKSEKLNSGLYKYEPTLSNVHVYYKPDANTTTNINVAGNRPGTYSNGNTQWSGSKDTSNETVNIRVEPAADGGGKVYITSQVLANRAVKYIEFDASVTFEVPILDANGQPTGRYDNITVTHHYLIQHFPLDNIQSVTGLWSSRWNGSNETRTVREYSWTQPGGWTQETAYFSYNEYNADRAHITRGTEQTGNYQNITNSWNGVNSEANSYFNESDGYCYWRTGGQGNRVYHRIRYSGTRYYRDVTVNQPSTGTWVSYDPQSGGEYYNIEKYGITGYDWWGRPEYGYFYGYYAKVISNGTICRMNAQGGVGVNANVAGNNTHMYIIQISKAGVDANNNPVIIGRPRLDANYQSNDNVVSPAFMIASQLGAVRSAAFEDAPDVAAEHCHTYMEVDENGRRFAGWRLPTKAEIAYIAGYQNNPQIQGQGVFNYVLTGNWYYTLDGGDAPSELPSTAPDYDADDATRYVRCIRDLTPAEVAELNSTGTITEATY